MSTGTSRRRLFAGLLTAATAVVVPLAAAAPAAAQPVPPPSAVIGGKPVPDDTYRFQVALLNTEYGDDDRDRQFCGGSLIGPYTVLTAAHCVDDLGDDPETQTPLSEIRAVIGRTVLSSKQGVRLTPVGVEVHPRWNSDLGTGPDVAVLYLPKPVRIPPVLLATRGSDALERPGRAATVTGWGNTARQPTGPGDGLVEPANRLRAAQVPIVADDECAAAYTFGDDDRGFDGAEMICAGRTDVDTCQGDSGGPMFVTTPAGYRQIGITSWGYGCGATGFPGVYTQVSAPTINDWVTQTTGGLPPQP